MVTDRVFICNVKSIELINGINLEKLYEIKAPSKAIARRISINKFYAEHSNQQFLSIDSDVKNKELDTGDNVYILNIFNTSFQEICKLVENKCSLLDFFNLYENFNGYNYSIDGIVSSFEVDFQGFCFRICHNGCETEIDKSCMTYTSNSGKKFVVEDNWHSIYLGN